MFKNVLFVFAAMIFSVMVIWVMVSLGVSSKSSDTKCQGLSGWFDCMVDTLLRAGSQSVPATGVVDDRSTDDCETATTQSQAYFCLKRHQGEEQ
jgi:hypothetical protein